MPRQKKTTSESVQAPVAQGETKLNSLLWQIRELCRKHHLQIWQKESLANQIYQDLLFVYHIPQLTKDGILQLDVQRIGDGALTEVSYTSLLSLKEPQLINTAFKRLWKELQRCVLKDLFEGRDFTMFAIEKKSPERYLSLLLDLFRYLASVILEKYDSNAGYTYFKKDLNKAIAKTFGQFYTPQTVTASVVKEVDPRVGESVLDPSCGSCSFLAEAANYIAKKEGVSMATAFETLYGTEVEFNIYAEGIMNMFINFGILPDMKNRIREVDALLDMAKSEQQFDKIVANPPFGADASTFHEFYFKTTMVPKGKRMVKTVGVNPEVVCSIPYPNTKESAVLFFQYIIQKLKVGGRAGVVMSSTLLNDGNKEMIQWFLESCSLEKIVINPANTFKEQGTSIETFSFIFTKGVPTTEVKIVMLGEEEKVVHSLTLDQIKAAGWKLQLKEEEKKEAYTGKFPLVKLGELADGTNGKGLSMEETTATPGEYPILSGGQNYCGTFGKYNRNENTISVSKSGSSSGFIRWNPVKFWASDCFTVAPKVSEILLNRYLYFVLTLQQELIYSTYQIKGTIPHCYWRDMESMMIALPPLPLQQEIVSTLERIFANPQDLKDCIEVTSNAMDLMLKDPTGKLLEDVLNGLRLKRAHLAAADSVKAQMAAVVRSVSARGYERKKLGDVLRDHIVKKPVSTKDATPGEFHLYSSSVDIFRHTTFEFPPGEYLLQGSRGTISKATHYTIRAFSASNNVFVLSSKDPSKLLLKYCYYYLKTTEVTDATAVTAVIPMLTKQMFQAIQIPVPPLPIQQEILAILDEMEAERKVLEQMAAKAEERARFILEGYLTPPPAEEENELVFEDE